MIEVGDYIRTKQWGIAKVAKVNEKGECTFIKNKNNRITHYFEQLGKASPNIIDLIEVGDILKIEEDGDIGYIGWEKDTTVLSYKEMIKDIKNGKVKLLKIVTNEQFNSIKYEVI